MVVASAPATSLPVPSVALRTLHIGDERAIFIGPATLVASKSQAGAWHIVESGQCSCIGFQHYGRCRHLAIAAQAEEQDREAAIAQDGWHCLICGEAMGYRLTDLDAICLVCQDVYSLHIGECANCVRQTFVYHVANPALGADDDFCVRCTSLGSRG